MAYNRRDIIFSAQAKCNFPNEKDWNDCILQLSRRYVYLVPYPNGNAFPIPIPNIASIEPDNSKGGTSFSLRISYSNSAVLVCFANQNDYYNFISYAENVRETSARVFQKTHEMIFSSNNADEESVDSMFVEILNSLYDCKNPTDLKHLLGKVKEYQNEADISILSTQKPYYINFVECLRYFSDQLVTDELMQYAESLINGFDDTVDDVLAGEELKPTFVNINEVFQGRKVLGKGKYGVVYVGRVANQPKELAVKRLDKGKISKTDSKAIFQEVAIMYKLRKHPHIVGVLAFWEDAHNYYIVQNYMAGGELFNAIVSHGSFSEAQAQRVILTLLFTLDYCHERGIVHRDLKPENLLLAEKDNLDSIRIADFGLAHQFDFAGQLKSYCGTPGYIAPEIISKQSYGPAVDMWSLGVIAYILLCGYHPFPQNNDVLLQRNVLNGVFDFSGESWADKSEESKDFIKRLLCVDPQQRMTARQAMTHRWMMFESKSTMNMNRAVQELERFNARKKARAVDVVKAAQNGYQITNYITLVDTLVYVNPTLLQAPVFSIPRSTILAVDKFIHASDGPWLHVFNKNNSNAPNSIDGKWILAGKMMNNPMCVPVNRSVYLSKYKHGKALHNVKASPTRTETIIQQIPGGYCVIIDEIIHNEDGTWGVINDITLSQFNITIPKPVYICIVLGETNVLFTKIYGK